MRDGRLGRSKSRTHGRAGRTYTRRKTGAVRPAVAARVDGVRQLAGQRAAATGQPPPTPSHRRSIGPHRLSRSLIKLTALSIFALRRVSREGGDDRGDAAVRGRDGVQARRDAGVRGQACLLDEAGQSRHSWRYARAGVSSQAASVSPDWPARSASGPPSRSCRQLARLEDVARERRVQAA